jgi:hypothetical protein
MLCIKKVLKFVNTLVYKKAKLFKLSVFEPLWLCIFSSTKLMEINLRSENKKNPFRPQAKRILQN